MENGEVEEVFIEEFKCEICRKTFKKQSTFDNHIQSKKHKDNEAKFGDRLKIDSDTEKEIEEIKQKLNEEKK